MTNLTSFFQAARAVPLTHKNGEMHPTWQNYFQQLNTYIANTLSPEGLQTPPQNSANIAVLNNMQSLGKIVYNTDTDTPLINVNGVFKTIVTV